MREVNVENYIGWKDKLFIFDEEDLVTIMKKLARWYDVDIFYNRVVVDAKSILGVMSLDLTKTLTVKYCKEDEEILEGTLDKFEDVQPKGSVA